MRSSRLLAVLITAALSTVALDGAAAKYGYYLTGNAGDAIVATTPGYVLMGGGTDVDAAFTWMGARAKGGDFVVIRATGADGYNPYVYAMGDFDSVETLVIKSRTAASDANVLRIVRAADALFIAGGNQADYVNYWKGTPLEDAIHDVASRAPVGGTSAGLAIMGEFVYSALRQSATSSAALANPYTRDITLTRDFLLLQNLRGVITDSHFVERDRMGRTLAFMARNVQDGWALSSKGIAVDSETALLVEPNGQVSVVANPSDTTPYAYFLSGGVPAVCQSGVPLTYRDVAVYRVAPGASFNLSTWAGSGGTPYRISAEAGVLTSTQSSGDIY